MMGLFGADAKKDPKEQVREWQRKMRQEQRQIDRQIANIQREEQKAVRQIREASKKKDQMDVCRILAKEIVRTRRAVTKMYTTKAQINSVVMHMQHEVAVIRMAGSIKASTEVRVTPSSPGFTLTQVMRSMQQLVRVPEIAATMRELSKEMMRTGLIEEMMEETIEQMEPDEFDDAVQNEVDKVLDEIFKGKLTEAPAVPVGSVSVADGELNEVATTAVANDFDEVHKRLEALRSDQ